MSRKWGYRSTPQLHHRPHFGLLAARLGVDTLPDSVDLFPHCPPVMDQGSTGSCVGMAHAGAIYTTLHAAGDPLPWVPSPAGIYTLARCIDRAGGTAALEDSGTDPALAQVAINEWGVRPLLTPGGDCFDETINDEPLFIDLETASANLLVGQYAITGTPAARALMVRQALANGIAVECGSFVDTAYMDWNPSKGAYGKPNYFDPDGGGHDQFLTRYITTPAGVWFRVRNSWGNWCDGGSVWVTEEFLGQCDDLNAIAVKRAS
jgi:hypothetical protein